MKEVPQGSESYRKRNRHLFKENPEYATATPVALMTHEGTFTHKRIRQSSKPLLNKLEQEWLDNLCAMKIAPLYPQSVKFRLANGCWYTPDMFAPTWNGPVVWEVKGKWFPDDAKAKLKMFATQYPHIRTLLVWKENGVWVNQRVLP